MIDDKKVGEMWKRLHSLGARSAARYPDKTTVFLGEMLTIIHKLVYERARYHRNNPEVGAENEYERACRDFKIPWEEFRAIDEGFSIL